MFYARFMDDWIIIAPTRWKLRKAIRIVNQTLNELRVEQHPDKTMIGRGDRGFDFLGYFLTPTGLEASTETVKRCAERIVRLYEQGADINRIGEYVQRWIRWLRAGVEGLDGLTTSVAEVQKTTAIRSPCFQDRRTVGRCC